MSSLPNKKGKSSKKGSLPSTPTLPVSGDNSTVSPFDYSALIPKNIDDRGRDLVKRFLCNELASETERDEALMIFAQALMEEHGGSLGTNKGDSTEQEELRNSVVATLREGTRIDEDTIYEVDPVAQTVTRTHTGLPSIIPADPDFVPNPACLNEERTRINVGWMAGPSDATSDNDKKIATYSQRLGCKLYNFVSYPIGGATRGFWTPTQSEAPPRIDLPDLQLQNHLWETYVNGQVSSWIDCDSSEEWLATLSEKELEKELSYVGYLGLRSVIIPLKHATSPRLAALVNKWLWTKNSNLAFWVFVPTDRSELIMDENDDRDMWSVWADFRTKCSNFTSNKLIAGLRLTSDVDDEFIEKKLVDRWKGEPLAVFWIGSDVFQSDQTTSKAVLPAAHSHLLSELWMSDSSRIMVQGEKDTVLSDNFLVDMANALRSNVSHISKMARGVAENGFLADGSIEYMDVLQAPLQPLSDNLDSNVYNTFEQDPIKYRKYCEAIEKAIHDFGEAASRPDSLVLYVLGAGRGPLVSASIEAETGYNKQYRSRHDRLKLKIVVVEKNVNAVVTLHFCNEKGWKNRCTIVESDMRQLPEKVKEMNLPQPDIIVSELLGSFGDNELSPECLDGVTSILKPTTISIPQSYTSYAAPIQSVNMYQSVVASGPSYWNSGYPGHGRQGTELQEDGTWRQSYPQGQKVANLDQVYVVFLRAYCPLHKPVPVFTFDHPNFENSSNERSIKIPFTIDRPSEIMGFAGYFHMTLYKDVILSIVPESYSQGMISWFPALIPLREFHRVKEGDTINFCIERKVDEKGVWYEWFIEYTENGETKTSVRQNMNGESYFMKLS